MADKGWIKLHRSLQDCWVWIIDEPFDKRSAWVDLLLSANHKEVKMMFNGELIVIKRGQILTSIRKLCIRWKWSTNKVYRFLNQLEKDFMIEKKSDNSKTLLSIIKYGVYQCEGNTDENTNGNTFETQTETPSEIVSDTPSETKQECKNIKNERNNNIMSISAINALFEELWLLYPRKKGKGQISDAKKRKIAEVGKEQMIRAIERYKRYVSTQKDLSYQYGSTFFNSGYIDYLDENYTPNDEKPRNQSGNNRFNNFAGRTYDMSSLEQQLLNN